MSRICCSADVGVGEAQTVRMLRETLSRVSYDEASVREIVGPDGLDEVRGLATVHLRPQRDQPLGRLVRLFLAGQELERESVAEAVEPLSLEELQAAGFIEQSRAGIKARVRLTPFHGLVVASDPHPSGSLPADHVVYPGPASATLAKVTIRSPVTVALDLCCGSGVQALLAAEHCEKVIGTELNPRALSLAAKSAALNGIENAEWRLGDLFAPVAGELFDLVVANPPFVISPSRELTFRDSGRRADDLSREVVVGSARMLADGGFGHVLCSWVRGKDEQWSDAPRRWLAGSGCDAVILQLDTQTSVSYAVGWASLDSATTAEAAERAAAWVEYYNTLGIERMTTGLIVMRRRSGSNWVRAEYPTSIGWGAGKHLARMFEGHDALDRPPDGRSLLDRPLQFAPGVSLVERWRCGNELERARLTGDGGLSIPGRITPPAAAPAFHALDGRRTLREAAEATGVSPTDLQAGLSSACDLVRRGYLVVNSGS